MNIVIDAKLYYFLLGKKIRHPRTGQIKESFDAVIKRLCGFNEG
jgi:hypothetical protein